ncbi:MAG TPA: potassium-transporting ATPase subunit KdpC [Allosphingosinicella sp.]|nr:potassium-transporting ATPase subunit KdpC [Allosphingosinicella sp.]
MFNDIKTSLRPAFSFLILLTLLTGILYPLTVTGLAQTLFPHQANGSLVRDGDRILGSELIGQNFTGPRYFHPRPSAAGDGYNAAASSGSNLGPTSRALADTVRERVAAARSDDGVTGPVPVDMVTASGSGLDPHVSPANALAQVTRVAAARGLPPGRVRALVEGAIEEPALGILGDPRVNVLLLNRQLDREAANRQSPAPPPHEAP